MPGSIPRATKRGRRTRKITAAAKGKEARRGMPPHLACHPQKADRLPIHEGCARGNVSVMGMVIYWERHLSRAAVLGKVGKVGTYQLEGPGRESGLRGDGKTVLAVAKYLTRTTGEPWFCIEAE